jgi:hypothetical protein
VGVLKRRRFTAIALVLTLTVPLVTGCGSPAGPARVLPGPSGRLNPIYDFAIDYPDTGIVVGGLTYRGLEIEAEIEFADATLRDDDPVYLATARVLGVTAGGVPQGFEVGGPLDLEGTLDGGALRTGLFGPIRIGNAALLLDLTGVVQDGSRRVVGDATLFGVPDRGWFTAVKRRRYLVAETDFQVIGKVAVVTVRFDSRFSIDHDLEVTGGDAVARVEDGRPFIVNRFTFDNLQGLDPFSSFETSFEYSTGNGSNPHDLVVLPPGRGAGPSGGAAPGLAFVTRHEPPYNDVAVIDLEDGTEVDRIDLTPYARLLPRADQALLHDGLLYVTILDANLSFTEFMNGRVVVIDPALRSVVDVIDLSGQNPFESLSFSEATGLIYVGLAGIFPGFGQKLSGGIEVVDPATRRSSLLVDDDALGGNVSALTIHSAERGYCVVTDASFKNFVKTFNPSTGEVLGTILESTHLIPAVEADGDGYLLVADRDFSEPRVIIFDAVSGRAVATLPTRQPPFSFAILTRSL